MLQFEAWLEKKLKQYYNAIAKYHSSQLTKRDEAKYIYINI